MHDEILLTNEFKLRCGMCKSFRGRHRVFPGERFFDARNDFMVPMCQFSDCIAFPSIKKAQERMGSALREEFRLYPRFERVGIRCWMGLGLPSLCLEGRDVSFEE